MQTANSPIRQSVADPPMTCHLYLPPWYLANSLLLVTFRPTVRLRACASQ
jgi:hypothetical protein|eukprot:COSAG01_NODE_457_length_16751_cov_34.906918_15_plen_50_part_00